MFKLVDKKILAILHTLFLLNWPYEIIGFLGTILFVAKYFTGKETIQNLLELILFYVKVFLFFINKLLFMDFCIDWRLINIGWLKVNSFGPGQLY